MRLLCCFGIWTGLIGLACAEEPKPNKKAGNALRVVQIPLGSYPTDQDAVETPPQIGSVPPAKNFALEGKFEVDKPANFQPLKLYVKITRKINGKKVIGNSHICQKPVHVKGKTFRYQSVMKSPATPGDYAIEIYHGKELIATGKLEVKNPSKKQVSAGS